MGLGSPSSAKDSCGAVPIVGFRNEFTCSIALVDKNLKQLGFGAHRTGYWI